MNFQDGQSYFAKKIYKNYVDFALKNRNKSINGIQYTK